MLTFGLEQFARSAEAVSELVRPDGYDLDLDRYRALERAGVLRFWTAREGSGLVGFLTLIVAPNHQHRGQIWAVVDLGWSAPEYRDREFFVHGEAVTIETALLARAEFVLAAEGVATIRGCAAVGDEGAFCGLGYRAIETVYAAVITVGALPSLRRH